ncbi:MAG: hypothetical protein MN733_43925, partial [Nitrososphaera sp.]|nr:hypothetical protein [Nitrososphaera sp.]
LQSWLITWYDDIVSYSARFFREATIHGSASDYIKCGSHTEMCSRREHETEANMRMCTCEDN